MKIYTKTGDAGETGLLGGVRVPKTHPAVTLTGTLDETNCLLGLAISELQRGERPVELGRVIEAVIEIQSDLFDLGSRVAACLTDEGKAADFSVRRSRALEGWIDEFQAELPPLKSFILPGGSGAGGHLHLARAVCRRAERQLVQLKHSEIDWPCTVEDRLSTELIYLNRLSDLLFVMARLVNHGLSISETRWVPSRNES